LGRAKKVLLISLFLILTFALFFHPLTSVLGNIHRNYSSWMGDEVGITIPEHLSMLLVGFVLIGIGTFAKRRFIKKVP